MASSGVFKPEPGIIALNVLAGGILVALAVAMTLVAIDAGPAWIALLSVALIAIGLWMMYRSLVMRVVFDQDSLHIVGFFRSRRIPWSAVIAVEESDLEFPLVRWALPEETDRWSVLTPMMLGSSAFLPASMYRRRHRFLATLRRWAPDTAADQVRLGFWSRLVDGFAQMMLMIWRSPALRIVAAMVAVAVAASAYWFGCVTVVDVIQGETDFSRGLGGTLILAGFAAEGAYWLLPMRRRHPRGWHVALALLLAPLAALLLVALFA